MALCSCSGAGLQSDVLGFCALCDLWVTELPCGDGDCMSVVDGIESTYDTDEASTEPSLSRVHGSWVSMYTNYMEVPFYKKDTWTSPEYHSECVKVLSGAMQSPVVTL